MAQQTAASVGQLRALAFRLSATPSKQLPGVAAQIAGSIWNCRDLLSTPSDAKQANDASTTVHRFKTQLSTLLQDRSIEGRWAAVVLVKATIEAGGPEVLAKCNPWVRNLLGILKKPDPPTTRNLAVVTLTRIFVLTWDYSNLVREITTPALTAFVPTCLANLENKRCTASEFQTILEAFATLLPRHPTIFRSNEAKIRTVLNKALSGTASDVDFSFHYTEAHKESAHRLYVLLHHCAPKQGASDKWDETLKAAVHASHSACDRVFRAVQEDWQSETGIESSVVAHLRSNGEVECESNDAAELSPWKGIYAGGERIVSLLGLINSHLGTATSNNVSVRLGLIADLLTRLLAIPTPSVGKQDNVKLNNQISRDEREAMFAVLPSIHIAAIQLVVATLQRFGAAASPWAQHFHDQAIIMFRSGRADLHVRRNLYQLVTKVLGVIGPSLSRNEFAELEQTIKSCCEDILPIRDANAQSTTKTNGAASGIKQQLGLADSESISAHPADVTEVQQWAQDLLRTILNKVDATCISPKLRALIDRAAVLTNSKEVVFASVMNPPKKSKDARIQASLLPILARQFGQTPDVEALLRPRMPPIFTKGASRPTNGMEDVDQEKDEEGGEQDVMEDEADNASGPGMLEQLAGASRTNLQEQLAPDANSVFVETSPSHSSSSKRRADEDTDTASSAKRMRASPVAESLMPDSMQTLPGPDPATHKTIVPETIVGEVASHPAAAVQGSSVVAAGVENDKDDDSDMELPPLTMEPDTDPEDEGEDD